MTDPQCELWKAELQCYACPFISSSPFWFLFFFDNSIVGGGEVLNSVSLLKTPLSVEPQDS